MSSWKEASLFGSNTEGVTVLDQTQGMTASSCMHHEHTTRLCRKLWTFTVRQRQHDSGDDPICKADFARLLPLLLGTRIWMEKISELKPATGVKDRPSAPRRQRPPHCEMGKPHLR